MFAVREDELSRTINEESLSVVVGAFDGMHPLAMNVARGLRTRGYRVLIVESNDHHRHARAANSFKADLYVGLEESPEPTASFYRTENFSSPAGERVATLLAERLASHPPLRGVRHPVLRETRMPAVLVGFVPLGDDLIHSAETLAATVETWWSESH